MTKGKLLAQMRTTRTAWETILSQIDPDLTAEPRTIGEWSIKDVIFHCTSYARVYVHALEAVLNEESLPTEVMDRTPIEIRNEWHFQSSQQRTLHEVLSDSQTVFRRLIELTEAHTEAFLLEPQQFEGVPEFVVVWKQLDHVCEQYRGHLDEINARRKESG